MPSVLKQYNVETLDKGTRYYRESESVEAKSPHCKTVSHHRRKGDQVKRTSKDKPMGNSPVFYEVLTNRYHCENKFCPIKIFTERFPGFVEEKIRVTNRFKEYCMDQALSSCCLQAERDIRKEGGVISNDTLGRYLKIEVSKNLEATLSKDDVKILAMDDINLRKGNSGTGCSVFVDGETHQVLIIVKGTTSERAKQIIDMFPSAEIVCSDRGKGYMKAGSESEKIQVADRFHLIANA